MLIQNYDLDMVPSGIPLTIHVSQYDTDVQLVFKLFASHGTLNLNSGATVMLRGLKRDGNGISVPATYSYADNVGTVTIQLTKQMTAVAGKNTFELLVRSYSGELYSANFILHVERSALDLDTVQSDSDVRELIDLATRADALIAAAEISEQTQEHMAELTERAEVASGTAVQAKNTAVAAKETAVEAKDTAVAAVTGFQDTVDAATQAAVDTVEDTGDAQAARVQTEGNTQIAAIRDEKDSAISDMSDAKTADVAHITAARDAAVTTVNNTKDAAVGAVTDTKDAAMQTINQKAQEIAAVKLEADTTAALAMQAANQALNEVGGIGASVEEQNMRFEEFDLALDSTVDGGYVENDSLYLTHNGEVVAGPFTGFGGGGSGGGSGSTNTALMTLTNTSGFASRTISYGSRLALNLEWSSVEDDLPTGNGTLTVRVNSIAKVMRDVAQGPFSVEIGEYLSPGTNGVQVSVTDSYGNSRVKNYSINAVDLSLTSSFDDSEVQEGILAFPYTPVGTASKTVHFILDDEELSTVTTSVSGRQQTYIIPQQSHGAHTLRVYFDAVVGGAEVRSNELYYEIIWLEMFNDTPIIASSYAVESVTQYATVNIPYTVYNPVSQVCPVSIHVGDELISQITVDRTPQVFSYRMDVPGEQTITITAGSTVKTITLTVVAADIDVAAETENLSLYLSAASRSNNEANPGEWNFDDVAVEFNGFNWTSDGWQLDNDGVTALRMSGGAMINIPYEIFARDFRTTGKTIEIEFATHEVLDYDTVIFSCMSGNRGISLTPQNAVLRSEQSEIAMQYKEDEHVRLTFVCEKRSENRLMLVYVNGIPSGVVQYPSDDDFSQVEPVGIMVGSAGCTTDLYCLRVYDNDLNRMQVLDNFIADTQDGALLLNRYVHNNVYDAYGKIIVSKLPSDLPYMILEAEELPQYKGDKKTITGSYTDPMHPENSFTFTGCQINVQGTSSAPYARKNYDLQFKQGFEMSTGQHADTYALRSTVVPFNRFVLKADVASSEGANNVELVRLFCDLSPFKTREMETDPRIRQGIDGFPIVVFWHDTVDGETSFLGKYNFNLPKRAPGPYGYSGDMESWEFQNNTSNLMLFKSDFFDETLYTDPDTGETKELWRYDYEARFPDDTWTDYTKLQELQSFIVSTDRTKATGEALAESVTYDGVEYTADTAEYRLAKFRAEFANYAEVQSFLFYYIFTELFLMVDSRAKNLFIGFSGADTDPALGLAIDRKAVAEPYDMDTGLGTNNEGSLVFGFSLEDTDHLEGGANVFNGQDSVLWCNLRDAFSTEIRQMYQTLRSSRGLSFDAVEARYEAHQSKWPEAVWIEDAWFKYINPLIAPDPGKQPTGVYLPMMQGSKEEQRKWWLYNRFRYMDSKWNAGDALSQVIQLRGYAKADITVTPYADIYPTIKYASYLVQERGRHGQPTTLPCPLDSVNDTEIYIYSAPQIASVGDLSGLEVGFADFSQATRLQSIKLGDVSPEYENQNLTGLTLGSNRLLKTLDVRNCKALGTGDQKAVDISGCTELEEAYFDNTKVTGVTLPNGGILRTLHLPGTITSLIIRNQPALVNFECPDTSHVTTLRLENVPQSIDTMAIVNTLAARSRIRLFNFRWELPDLEGLAVMLDTLDTMRGLDQNGNNVDKPQLYGTIHVPYATGDVMYACRQRYPDVNFTYDHVTATIFFHNRDALIGQATVIDGAAPENVPTPSYSDAQYTYTFAGWSSSNNDVVEDGILNGVEIDKHVYAAYTKVVRTYRVRFYNGTTLLATFDNVPYGTTVEYDAVPDYYDANEASDWVFRGWTNDANTIPITGNTDCYSDWRYIGFFYKKFIAGQLAEYEDTEGLITYVGENAFKNYTTLKSISLPAAVTVNANAFSGASNLESVSLPNVVTVRSNAFYNCTKLKSITLPLATLVENSAFGFSGLESVSLPELETVPQYMLRCCYSVKNIHLPKAKTIGYAAFESNRSVTSISLPEVTTVAKYTFMSWQGCTQFDLPKLENITELAFSGCSAVQRLDLPRARKLDTKALGSMSHLKWVRIGGTANDDMFRYASIFDSCPQLEAIVIDGVTSVPPCLVTTFNGSAVAAETCYIYVPANMVDAFKTADNWSTYANQIRAIEDYPDLYDMYLEGGDA